MIQTKKKKNKKKMVTIKISVEKKGVVLNVSSFKSGLCGFVWVFLDKMRDCIVWVPRLGMGKKSNI